MSGLYVQAANQQIYELQVACSYPVRFRAYHARFNYTTRRDDLWRGLEYLFPKDKHD